MISNMTKFARLENKKTIFFEIGMILALAIVLCAFNWKSYDKIAYPDYARYIDDTPVDLAPVTIQKRPEPPQIKKPLIVYTINIVEDDQRIDDDYFIDAEADPLDTMPVYYPMPKMSGDEPPVDEQEIFRVVESMPEFPGGEASRREFLQQNLHYPRLALETGISGKVYITFVVERDGSITDIQLLRGIGGGCDEEALRVVKMMPQWKPGLQRGHAVRVQFIMDIKYTLAGI